MLEEAVSDMAAGRGTDLQTLLSRFSSPLPLKRIADPEEIAKGCSFLAGEDSSFITGAVLVIDGGSSIVDVSAASLGY